MHVSFLQHTGPVVIYSGYIVLSPSESWRPMNDLSLKLVYANYIGTPTRYRSFCGVSVSDGLAHNGPKCCPV